VRAVEEAVSLAGADADTPERKQRRRKQTPTEFVAVADRLAERFETRVKVDGGAKGRGKVVIEFAGLDDLQRIVDLLEGSAPTA
jgi:ParB family chromosome partitioning protein